MDNQSLKKIKEACCIASGITIKEIESNSRKRIVVSAKTIYIFHASKITMNVKYIAESVSLGEPSYWKALQRYNDSIRFDRKFKLLAEEVEKCLR